MNLSKGAAYDEKIKKIGYFIVNYKYTCYHKYRF